MEAFSMLKFWRITAAESALDDAHLLVIGKETDDDDETEEEEEEEEEDEDSFFDLELGVDVAGGKETEIPKQSTPESESDDVSVKQSSSKAPCLSPTSLLRSPPKFPVFMLFKKSKCRELETPQLMKSEEDEEVRISSILASTSPKFRKCQKQSSKSISKKLRRADMVTKYAKLIIKPLYVKVSRRYGETAKISDEKTARPPPASSASLCSGSPRKSADDKQGPGPGAGFRVVCKQYLRKSLNGSSSAGMIPIPARRDDRLMEQHDGIQGAILHCKKSYTSSSSSSSSSGASESCCMISELSKRGYSWKKTVLEEKRFSI